METRVNAWFHDFLDAPTIGAQAKNATEVEGSQLGNTRKRKESYWGGMKGKAKAKEGVDLVKVRQRAKPEKGTKMTLSPDTKNKAMEAARYGMPIERIAMLCGFSSSETQWARWINANPAFRKELDQARAEGELLLQRKIMSGEQNWQAAGWMLERTRGYVARAQLDHTTKGKELSVSGNLLGAFGGQSK